MSDRQKFIVFSMCLVLATGYVLSSFLPGFIWGAILAISLWPIAKKLNSPNTALMLTSAVLVSLIIPLVYVGYQLVETYSILKQEFLKSQATEFEFPKVLLHFPFADKLQEVWTAYIQNSENLKTVSGYLLNGTTLSKIPEFGASLSSVLVLMLCAVVCMYFMLKNMPKVETSGAELLKNVFGQTAKDAILNSLTAVRGTINGVVLIGLVEGVLLSIPLVLGGIKAGLLIGFTAGILGVIPLVLPILILPCAAYFYFTGSVGFAIFTIVCMCLVWFVFENIYKPKLISDAVKVHPLIVLMSLIGGLQVLGALGLFIGPAIVASAIGVIAQYTKKSD